MILKISISTSVNIKDDQEYEDAKQEAIVKLAAICDMWLEGQMTPIINFEFELPNASSYWILKIC